MRLTAKAYAEHAGVSQLTVQRWCRNSMLPAGDRNRFLPPIVCRRVGKGWQINSEETDRAQSRKCGNAVERSIVSGR